MDAFLSREEFATLTPLIEAGARTVMNTWTDTYAILRTARPGGWDSGTEPEAVTTITEVPGFGKLTDQGPGPGDTVDAVIVNLTPTRFRLPAATVLDPATDALRINGVTYLVDSLVTLSRYAGLIAEAALTRREGD